jgi:hypothetical protein
MGGMRGCDLDGMITPGRKANCATGFEVEDFCVSYPG